jgi:hypothetical protein
MLPIPWSLLISWEQIHSCFPSGMQNHDTQSTPWAYNNISLGIPKISSHFPSSPSPSYMNPSFGLGGMMPPFSTFLFDGSHIPQSTLMVGGWNLPPHGSNPSFTFLGASAQMGGYSTYYTLTIYTSSAIPVPTNIHLSSSISYRGSQFYNTGYPLHEVSSPGGNIYPHLSNPCHDTFFSQATSSVMMPLQPAMNQFGGRYYPVKQGHGVYLNPSWPAIS